MALCFFDVDDVYAKDRSLQKEDVGVLIQWVKSQHHLPHINEAQATLFLYRWQYDLELAKTAIDSYFTVKTYCSEIFLNRSLSNSHLKQNVDISLYTVLSQKSHQGYYVFFCKMMISDPNRYCIQQLIKLFDMVLSMHLYNTGPSEGYILIFDLEGFTLELVGKTDIISESHFLYYIQNVAPVKFKQFHIINPVQYMARVLALIKPFLQKQLADAFYIHETFEDFYEYVPQSCLPKDYGGSEKSFADLHAEMEKNISENVALFDWEDKQIADESKRLNKCPDVLSLFEKVSIRNEKFEID